MSEAKGPYESLSDLLEAAREASPSSRIDFRDAIAAHGDQALAAIEPWFQQRELAGFAVRVAERAATYASPGAAAKVLRTIRNSDLSDVTNQDAADALRRLGVKGIRPRSAPRTRTDRKVVSPDGLRVGQTYKRRDLHLQGIGGSWQSGVSYPANGNYVLLFSDPIVGRQHGYIDRWVGDEFMLYGRWNGTGDMVLEGGNRVILERSNDLHLFLGTPQGYRYEGRFDLVGTTNERTVREGREWTAIVFRLKKHDLSVRSE
jgi:hypothetical protein